MTDRRIIHWDGKHLPAELKTIPPGEYALEPLADTGPTEEEERGILAALKELDAGQGKSLADVIAEIRSKPSRP